MLEEWQHRTLCQAKQYWVDDQPVEAGRIIFETIPVADRHRWASQILELVLPYFAHSQMVLDVRAFAREPDKWGRGRDSQWQEALQMVRTVGQDTLSAVQQLAYLVGKVVYTAQGYPAPFDHAAGWEIAAALKKVIEMVGEESFAAAAWDTLCDKTFITLETPVMCHPACPLCNQNSLI